MHVFGTSSFIVAAISTIVALVLAYGAARLAELPSRAEKAEPQPATRKKYNARKTPRRNAPRSTTCANRTNTGEWPICPPLSSEKAKHRREPIDEDILRGKADIRRAIHALLHDKTGDRRNNLEQALFLYSQAPYAIVSLLWLPIDKLTAELSDLTRSFLAENFTRLEESGDPKAYRALKNFFEQKAEFKTCGRVEAPIMFGTRLTEWELCERVGVKGLGAFDALRSKHRLAPLKESFRPSRSSATIRSRSMRTQLTIRTHAPRGTASKPRLLAATH